MTETRSVIVEREIAFPPERIWRALTQPHFIEEWLMKNDFAAEVGRGFTLRAQAYGDWDGIIDCEVLTVEPEKSLSYTWESGNGPLRVTSVITWTLTPTGAGTLLRMEQSGFRSEQVQNFEGAKYGWRNFFVKLEALLARTDG